MRDEGAGVHVGVLEGEVQFLHRGAVLGGVVELLEVDFDARGGDVGQFGFGVEEGGVVVGDCGGDTCVAGGQRYPVITRVVSRCPDVCEVDIGLFR